MSVSRKEVCQELKIDDYQLSKYEQFLQLAETEASSFDYETAKIIARIHELNQKGLGLNDIRQLSYFAEQYSDIIPSLKEFEEFSPQYHLRDLINYCNEMISEMSAREEQYQAKILELEQELNQLQIEGEQKNFLIQEADSLKSEYQDLSEVFVNYESELKDAKIYTNDLEIRNEQLKFENLKKDDEIQKLRIELDLQSGSDNAKRSAIDIQALLRKKEKEVALKFQREILDLKKQVETMMERRELEWQSRKL
ncbi:MAG: hypothetical protein LW817_04960 [Candidatus Caenarcaniphilales bacterium]|jgi:hypothetical protein|nr:hypothetical protein [Candidatus Caenarcaniphilales bacterium]